MARRHLVSCLGLCTLLSAAVVPARAALVGHWAFNEAPGAGTAVDSAGGHNGTLSQGAAFVTGGVQGNAVQFGDGNAGGYKSVDIPLSMMQALSAGGNNDFAVSLWLNPTDAFTNYETIFDSPGRHLSTWIHSSANGNGDRIYYAFGQPTHAEGEQPFSPPPAWMTNAWQHYVLSYDATAQQLTAYRDGTQILSLTGVNAAGYNATWHIGGNPSTGGTSFDGLMDDVQVYNDPLTLAQVQFLFNNPGAEVPEPAGAAALAVIGLALAARRRRRPC
jgi:hypothetical protein